jgi:predicted GH43/DUF377 family glycosyl hydrolase
MNKRPLHATAVPGFLIEPLTSGPTAFWEGHHTTNPCAIRLSGDPRVFLGYRAGGTEDFFRIKGWDVWRSHLGMAVLNDAGDKVVCRLSLPIFEKELDFPLPQTEAEFEVFKRGPHGDEITVLHDFRLWEDDGWLYCIYHEGAVDSCFDCIVRMRTTEFLAKIERSIGLASRPVGEIRDEWRALWWAGGVWQPAGVNGTNRIYPSSLQKNDIVFIRLADGGLRMLHRPVPDIAILDTKGKTFASATTDGITEIGSVQSSIRPGRADNSHIGNNGLPTRARIGDVDVYVDVVHGVLNQRIADAREPGWDLEYRAYFRVLDYATGDLLYYSEEPIFPNDEMWRAYTRDGAWVKKLPHLRSVMFAGGQVPANPKKIGLDDTFHAYLGVGDTAVALAKFTPRQLLPEKVVADIQERKSSAPSDTECAIELDERVCGWRWTLRNSPSDARIQIVRRLDAIGETNAREIYGRPGYFDTDGLALEPDGVRRLNDLGWVAVYRGWRRGESGYGLLLLDRENPERIFYRSVEPVEGADVADVLRRAEDLIPEKVRRELRFIYQHQPMRREMILWLTEKAKAAGVS